MNYREQLKALIPPGEADSKERLEFSLALIATLAEVLVAKVGVDHALTAIDHVGANLEREIMGRKQ